MNNITIGLHLNCTSKSEVTVSEGQTTDDGRVIAWVSVSGMNIYCNTIASAEAIAEALRAAIDTPMEFKKEAAA